MSSDSHPYAHLPDIAFWRRAVTDCAPEAVDPACPAFSLGLQDRVATAGSCFAQHIGGRLKKAGMRYLVTEPAHPLLSDEAARKLQYNVFTARYGNVYTSRQLLQLFERAYGRFMPQEAPWLTENGAFLDPFRPAIQATGFNSLRELEADRENHLAAVRTAFETMDVFVFTLGLTETWVSRVDGAAFPACPGTKGGVFDPAKYEFINLEAEEVVADMDVFLRRLQRVNPQARVILTVSPVPLAATALTRHVLTSTTYSKAVLRVACDKIARAFGNVDYFPAYEIVAGGFGGLNYYESDRRAIAPAGVDRVMEVFLNRYCHLPLAQIKAGEQKAVKAKEPTIADAVESRLQIECDEEALDPDWRARSHSGA